MNTEVFRPQKRLRKQTPEQNARQPLSCNGARPAKQARLSSSPVAWVADGRADPGYLLRQPELSVRLRSLVVDWLASVHLELKLAPRSLHLAVNLLDRYLSSSFVGRHEVSALALTCLALATKYEEAP